MGILLAVAELVEVLLLVRIAALGRCAGCGLLQTE